MELKKNTSQFQEPMEEDKMDDDREWIDKNKNFQLSYKHP